MRYVTLGEVFDIYFRIMAQAGGAIGIRDLGALESALAQPRMTFAGDDLYSLTCGKAVAPGYSMVMNHPFVDRNKRAGHAAMEVFLVLNGFEIRAGVADQEKVSLGVAAGELKREAFATWLRGHIQPSRVGTGLR